MKAPRWGIVKRLHSLRMLCLYRLCWDEFGVITPMSLVEKYMHKLPVELLSKLVEITRCSHCFKLIWRSHSSRVYIADTGNFRTGCKDCVKKSHIEWNK